MFDIEDKIDGLLAGEGAFLVALSTAAIVIVITYLATH